MFEWQIAPADTLRERLAESHLTTFRRPPQPLAQWIARARASHCTCLIANAMENQPHVTGDHRLLVEHGEQVIEGLAILALAAEIRDVFLAVDSRYTNEYHDLPAPALQYSVNRVALPHKYPIGADNILIHVLTRRAVPSGGRPADIGVAVIDVATCFAAYRWVACEERLGGRSGHPGRVACARAGQSVCPLRRRLPRTAAPRQCPPIPGWVHGRLPCPPETVTGPDCDAVLALDPTPTGAAAQCIRCGWCRDHCPARLNVAALNDMHELAHLDQADRLGALSCVGCGVCSYICPARLPLTERVQELKRTLCQTRQSMPLFTAPGGPSRKDTPA